jgi:hypothetical protein
MTKHDEIAALRQELKDLVAATVRQDPPLSPYTMCIAQAKTPKLQRQIKALEEARAPVGQLARIG